MKKLTGSQRKARRKQRTVRFRRQKPKSYVTLYHGPRGFSTYDGAGKHIRGNGLTAFNYSPGPSGHVYSTVTMSKKYARSWIERPVKFTKKGSVPRYTKGTKLITIRLPKKVMHKYTVRAVGSAYKQEGKAFGLRQPIPAKYIR